MADDYFCPEDGYTSSTPGACPYDGTPLVNVSAEAELTEKKDEEYPIELLAKEEKADEVFPE